jgi:hypothetical protein
MTLRVWIAIAAVAGIAAAAGGFLIGSASAPTKEEASRIRSEAYTESLADARTASLASSRIRGLEAGRASGQREGARDGARRGAGVGSEDADAQLLAAVRARAAERAANCGAPLFVSGYCPTNAEIQQENQAEANAGLP